jgi:D-glycero-beta-D-manno-heptose 1-phosphate adenylyltransferase
MAGKSEKADKTGKVIDRPELIAILRERRRRGERVVFTNGCFDLLHAGHVRYLQAARALGDLLVIGLNTDASVRTLNKGADRPLVPQAQRAEVLAALACVEYVVLFDEADPRGLIQALEPDVLVKGGDWRPDQIVGRDFVEARGGTVTTIPLVPGISTTAIVEKIKQSR